MGRMIVVVVIGAAAVSGAWAEDWHIGVDDPNEVVVQTADKVVQGDIYLYNNSRLRVDGARLTVFGDIHVMNAATLEIDGGGLWLPQSFSYQYGLIATDQATLSLVDATIDGNGSSHSVALVGMAAATCERMTVENGFSTWTLFNEATAELSDCTNAGEFVVLGENAAAVDYCLDSAALAEIDELFPKVAQG